MLGGLEAGVMLADRGYDADARMLDQLAAAGIAPPHPAEIEPQG